MYIKRPLLLLGFGLFFLVPPLADWLTGGDGPWYGAHVAWLVVIALIWWGQRAGRHDAL